MKNMLQSLTFEGRPDTIKEKHFRKFLIITFAGSFALLVHLAFIPLFLFVGVTFMGYLNIASVAAWAFGIYLNFKGKHSLAIQVVCTEVLVHSVFATVFMGTSVGFQYYLWSISALAIINTQLKLTYSTVYSFFFVLVFGLLYLVFGLLYLFFGDVQYTYKYVEYVNVVHFANVLIAGVPLTLSIAVTRYITLYQEARLSRLASQDPLTGLYNRRFACEMVDKNIKQALRNKTPLCFVLGDIDHFKNINDSFGHDVGDEVLKDVSQLFRSDFRAVDIVSRWGGEEFLIVLPGADGDAACKAVDKIRETLYKTIAVDGGNKTKLSMSFGIAEWQAGDSMDDCVKRADDALYSSKENGRNRVTLASRSSDLESTEMAELTS